MNAMPTPPPDPGYWFNIAEHIEGIAGFTTGIIVAAGAALWRMAVWTTSIKAEMERDRLAAEARQSTILDKLAEMQKNQHDRHEAIWREMDQIHLDVRADREETRAMRQEANVAAATLSGRIDSLRANRS